jgi:hypothetical protein
MQVLLHDGVMFLLRLPLSLPLDRPTYGVSLDGVTGDR